MNTLAQRLKKLSSAEDFLEFFGLPYEHKVLNVSRLHILKRFFQYIRQEQALNIEDETEMFRHMRSLLAKSYDDFVNSTPAREKVFKVFQMAEGQRIPVESLKRSLKGQRRSVSAE